MSNIIELINVRKEYQEKVVFDQLSLCLPKNKMVALTGPSGSGKTTLLNVVGLLDDINEGKIIFNGSEVSSLSNKKKNKLRGSDIGFMFQFHHLLPNFSVLENIALPQLPQGLTLKDAKLNARFLLEKLSLNDLSDRRPSEISGGQRQRVALCRALANKPRLLIADEPTGSLDGQSTENLYMLLREIMTNFETTILFATHDLDLAAKADTQIKMNDILTKHNGN